MCIQYCFSQCYSCSILLSDHVIKSILLKLQAGKGSELFNAFRADLRPLGMTEWAEEKVGASGSTASPQSQSLQSNLLPS